MVNSILFVLILLVIAGWLVRFLLLISNYHKGLQIKPDLRKIIAYQNFPLISILIPARNERVNLPRCLDSVLNQNYPRYEVVVADDRSDDETPQIIRDYTKRYPDRLRSVAIRHLPSDWTGKNHAVHCAYEASSGEWLLLTDADTVHEPGCLLGAYEYAQKHGIDMLSLSPRFINVSLFEKMVQPVAGAILALWFPWRKINAEGTRQFFANGQFILLRREVYERVGGHAAIKQKLLEDMALAQRIKSLGYRIRMAAGYKIFGVRMYDSVKRFWSGWRRIYTEIVDRRIEKLALMIASALFFSVLPFAILGMVVAQWLITGTIHTSLFALTLTCCFLLTVVSVRVYTLCRSNPFFVLLHPINVLIVTAILVDGIIHILTGRKTTWRGVEYAHASSKS